jgi:translation elongation factor EF-4
VTHKGTIAISAKNHVPFKHGKGRFHTPGGIEKSLIFDASWRMRAHTQSHLQLALETNLELIPILNVIGLPDAAPGHVATQSADVIVLDVPTSLTRRKRQVPVLTKFFGEFIEKFLVIPQPEDGLSERLPALVVDSTNHPDRGKSSIFVPSDSVQRVAKNHLQLVSHEKMVSCCQDC